MADPLNPAVMQREIAIEGFLGSLVSPPAGMEKSPQEMTLTEARDAVLWLYRWGRFKMDRSGFTVDKAGTVTPPGPLHRVKIVPAQILGIQFAEVTGYTWNPKVPYTVSAITSKDSPYLDNLDMRNVVLLYRLAQFLNNAWSARKIYHIGIGHGKGDSNDCHNSGRAIDFAGIVGGDDGNLELTVPVHWSGQPACLPSAYKGRAAGKVEARGPGKVDPWPEDYTTPFYRLDNQRNAYLRSDLVPDTARDFFQEVYDFAKDNCADASTARASGGPATTLDTSVFICHPDHHDPKLRNDHWNHFHFQVGPSGAETPPVK
jgi:hypothetical protein